MPDDRQDTDTNNPAYTPYNNETNNTPQGSSFDVPINNAPSSEDLQQHNTQESISAERPEENAHLDVPHEQTISQEYASEVAPGGHMSTQQGSSYSAPVAQVPPVQQAVPSAQQPNPMMPTSPRKGPPKILLIALMLFMLLVVVGGAVLFLTRGSGDDEITEPTDTEGEVVWWGLEDEEIYRSVIEKYEGQNSNVTITYVQQSPIDYRERLTNALAKGEGPDIFTYHNSWVPMFNKELDIVPSFVMNAEEFESTFYPIAKADLEVAGKGIVGIPLEYDALTLFVNEDIFATAGRTFPDNWDDLRVRAKELTQRDSRGIISQSGAALGITDNIDNWPEIIGFMLFQNHASPSKPSGTQARDAIAFYSQFASDAVWNASLPNSTVSFANGDVAMYFGTAEDAATILSENPSFRFSTIELPQLRRDDPNEVDVTYATYWVQGVWLRSESRGVAWRFLDYMSSADTLREVYQNATEVKKIGDPYPRQDMAPLLENDQYAGSVVRLAPVARSWYLADETNDGLNGINTQVGTLYEKVVKDVPRDLAGFSQQVASALAQFGIVAK